MIALGPFGTFHGADLAPQRHRIGPLRALGRIRTFVMPAAVLQGDGEDVHDRVVERFAAGHRVHFLRIVGAGADHMVRVMTGADDDAADLREIADLRPHAPRQIDERLALVFGRMLLGVGVEDGALGLAPLGQWHDILRLRTAEQPGDEAILALVGGRRRALAAHRPVDGFDCHLAREGRRIGLPARNLALARLARRRRHMQCLLHRLVDDLHRQAERRADAGGGRRSEMGDVIDLVLVQANALHEVDLDLVGGGQAADEGRTVETTMLGDGEHRRDVVTGVRVVRGQERVVIVELTHRDTVGPGRPFRRDAARREARHAEQGGARLAGMRLGLRPRTHDRRAVE